MAELAGAELSSNSPAPVKKRSLFTKPTYTPPTEAEQAVEFFSRAKEIFPERIAEEERKRQKKLAKLERKRSTASAERKASQTPESKRRRVSSQADEEERYHYGGSPINDGHKERRSTRRTSPHSTTSKQTTKHHDYESQESPTNLLGRYTKNLKAQEAMGTRKTAVYGQNYISLSDSEDEGAMATVRPIVLDDDDDDDVSGFIITKSAQVEEEAQLSDEEFPELVARAREREKQKELERVNTVQSSGNQSHDLQGGPATGDDIFQAPFTSSSEADPTIELLITSELDGTNPLKVRRKLSQRLKEVRLSWCDKQRFNGTPMNAAVRDAVFFTWKGIRLYDYTTCKSLGFNKIRTSGSSFEGDGFDSDGRVHLEVWTEDTFAAYESMRLKQKLNQDSGNDELPEETVEDKTEKMRLILVDRDSKELKIMVKTTTLISKLISVFRDDRDIDEIRDVTLYFDGDKLDPETTVADADLANMDSVEVHVR